MSFKILVTDPISILGFDLLKKSGFEIIDATTDKRDINSILGEIHGWIIRSGTQISKQHLELAKNLQVIGRAGVGVDNIDINSATQKGVVVMNVPDGNSISAAEHTLAMLIALSRNVQLGHMSIKDGRWDRAKLVGNELRGKILGVVGLGRIGREVIKRALSFEMHILGFDPYVNKELFDDEVIKVVDLDTLSKESDYITLHVPLNKGTKDLFDTERLSMMKPTARIINVARGGIINEEDLSVALDNNIIAGAAIDVFSSEPLDKANPLVNAKNILLTPHLGASTHEAKEGVSLSICNQVIDYLKENKLSNALNIPISDMSLLKKLKPYLELSEMLGKIQSQLSIHPIDKIEIKCYGNIDDTKAITIAFIKGFLSNIIDDRVNYINALTIAEERGIKFNTTHSLKTEKYSNMIDSFVYTKDETTNIGGGVFSENNFHILKIMNHQIDFKPEGNIILARNKDIPGVIGKVGTMLGEAKINIAEFLLSRPNNNEHPISIIKVDNKLEGNNLVALKKIDEILEIRQFKA